MNNKKILEEFRNKIYGKEDALFDRSGNNVSLQVENFLKKALQQKERECQSKIKELEREIKFLEERLIASFWDR